MRESTRVQVEECRKFGSKLRVQLYDYRPRDWAKCAAYALVSVMIMFLAIEVPLAIADTSEPGPLTRIFQLRVYLAVVLLGIVWPFLTWKRHHDSINKTTVFGLITFKEWIETVEEDMRPLANKKSDMTLPSQLMRIVMMDFDTGEVKERIICAQLLSQALAAGTLMGTRSLAELTRAIHGTLRRISNVNQQRQYALVGAMIPQDTAYVASAILFHHNMERVGYPDLGFQ